MNYNKDRIYLLFIKEHLPLLQLLFKNVINPNAKNITFENFCNFAYNNTTVSENELSQNKLWQM